MKAGYHSVNDELNGVIDLTVDHVLPLLISSDLAAWKIDDCLLTNFDDGNGQRYSLVIYKRNDLFSLMWSSYNRNDFTKNTCVYSEGESVSPDRFCIFYQDMVVPNGTFVGSTSASKAVVEFFENPQSPSKKINWFKSDEFGEWPDHVV